MHAENNSRGREEGAKQLVQEKTSRVDPHPAPLPCSHHRIVLISTYIRVHASVRETTCRSRTRARARGSTRVSDLDERKRFERARATIAFGNSERRESSWTRISPSVETGRGPDRFRRRRNERARGRGAAAARVGEGPADCSSSERCIKETRRWISKRHTESEQQG